MRANQQLLFEPQLATTQVLDPIMDQVQEDVNTPIYRVLMHNDDVTPYEYVIGLLGDIFFLSEELADHIAYTAHHEGTAVVVLRPRPEAERLIGVAHARARLDNFPLTFSLEQD